MLISNYSDFHCAEWEPFAETKDWYVPPDVSAVYVRFQDRAGNISETYSAPVAAQNYR